MVNEEIVVGEKRTRKSEIELSNVEKEHRLLCRRWRIMLDSGMSNIGESKQEMY